VVPHVPAGAVLGGVGGDEGRGGRRMPGTPSRLGVNSSDAGVA
jgi:hypothetical protein